MNEEKNREEVLLSIIVPVYNVEKYLKECVDSLLHQTLSQYEVILVDDGSTDSSGKICDRYASKDTRIKVVHKKKWRAFVSKECWFGCCKRTIYRFC